MNFYVYFDFCSKMESHGKNDKDLTYILFIFINSYWSIAALQCRVGFGCVAKWIGYMYARISSFWVSLPFITTENWVEFPMPTVGSH